MQYFDTSPRYVVNHGLAFSPDGRWLAVLARADQFTVLDTLSGDARKVALPAGTWPTTGVVFAGDDRLVGFAVAGGRFRLRDASSGEPVPAFAEVTNVRAVAARGDGRELFAARTEFATGSSDILRWGPELTPLPVFGKHRGWINAMAVSADGRWVAAGGGKHARVWNLGGKDPPLRAACHLKAAGYVKSLAVSRDGAVLAAAVRNRVVVWDVKSGEEKFQYTRHKRAVNAVAFAPARALLLSGGNEGLVFAYDPTAGKELVRLEWDIGPVAALAFAPDGLRCAAAGEAGKVVVWDVDV